MNLNLIIGIVAVAAIVGLIFGLPERFVANVAAPTTIWGSGFPWFRTIRVPVRRRGMSYDLRGDIPIPLVGVSPWYFPEAVPLIQ